VVLAGCAALGAVACGDDDPVDRLQARRQADDARALDGFGVPGLKRVYGVEFEQFRPLDVAGPLTVAALKDNKVGCANLFSTQSAIPANGFITLEDPKLLAPSEAVTPLIAKAAATPEVSQILNDASSKLTTDNLKELVKRVEIDKDDSETVASDFLSENGLS
jgi:osmoprotectant transport system substrate-binding protein